jgi:hypothetical protein
MSHIISDLTPTQPYEMRQSLSWLLPQWSHCLERDTYKIVKVIDQGADDLSLLLSRPSCWLSELVHIL